MTTTISRFTLIVSQLALQALPSGIAATLTLFIVTVARAQDGTDACKGKWNISHQGLTETGCQLSPHLLVGSVAKKKGKGKNVDG